jgi:hypothetical protein
MPTSVAHPPATLKHTSLKDFTAAGLRRISITRASTTTQPCRCWVEYTVDHGLLVNPTIE